MEGESLAIVEADSHGPFLPAQEIAICLERGTFGLDDLVGLGGCAWWRSEIGMILAHLCWVDLAVLIWSSIFASFLALRRGQMVNLGDYQLLGYFCTELKWIGVVVGVQVIEKTHVKVTLIEIGTSTEYIGQMLTIVVRSVISSVPSVA